VVLHAALALLLPLGTAAAGAAFFASKSPAHQTGAALAGGGIGGLIAYVISRKTAAKEHV
jgi:hypothetical protein